MTKFNALLTHSVIRKYWKVSLHYLQTDKTTLLLAMTT